MATEDRCAKCGQKAESAIHATASPSDHIRAHAHEFESRAPRMTTREALRSAVAREVGPGKVDAVLRAMVETLGVTRESLHDLDAALKYTHRARATFGLPGIDYGPHDALSALLDSVEPATDG